MSTISGVVGKIKTKNNNNIVYNKTNMPKNKKKEEETRHKEIIALLAQISGTPKKSDSSLSAKNFKARVKEILHDILIRNNNREKAKALVADIGETKNRLPPSNASRLDWERSYRNAKERFKRSGAFLARDPQITMNRIMNRSLRLSDKQIEEFYNYMRRNKDKFLIEFKTSVNGVEKNFTKLFNNDFTKNNMMRYFLKNGYLPEDQEDLFGSDVQNNARIDEIISIRIRKLDMPKRIMPNKNGRFFPALNTTAIPLEKYQIYREDTIPKKRQQCLLEALIQAGVSEELVENIKSSYIENDEDESFDISIKRTDLKKISEIIGKQIVTHSYDDNKNKERIQKTGIGNEIHIAIHNNHYFVYETTIYSSFSIKNYNEVKDEEDFNDIYLKKYNNKFYRDKNRSKLSSLKLVVLLEQEGHFTKNADFSKFPEASKHIELVDIDYLDNIENEQRPHKTKVIEKDYIDLNNVWACDTETYTNTTDDNPKGHHKLAIIGSYNLGSEEYHQFCVADEFSNQFGNEEECKANKCVNRWLDKITDNGKQGARVYFHNLKYDKGILIPYLYVMDKCEKDGQVYSIRTIYKNCIVELWDSMKYFNQALNKMPTTFDLPKELRKKEAIAYSYYTPENYNKIIPTSEYRQLLSKKDQIIFDQEVIPYTRGGKFNPWEYYKTYLQLDCQVLGEGLKKFNDLLLKITDNKISLFDKLTIASFADATLNTNGVYEGVYENKGNLRTFIDKSVRGGRVNCNSKFIKKEIRRKIADYDGVSLYPSSMVRLCRSKKNGGIGGLPIGMATRFNKDELHTWNDKVFSILHIRIIKIGKKQRMPIIQYKDSNGISQYTSDVNDLPKEGVHLNSIDLEDFIKFCEIEYEIIGGIYWNKGTNDKMREMIEKLFNERLKAKRDKNMSLSEVLKLVLNSAYGKTGAKKTFEKSKIKKTDDVCANYIYNNFESISEISYLNKSQTEITERCIDDSYNRNHIASAILSMSRRIVNEVFDVANDNGIDIYYTDTDSMHLDYDKVPLLEQKFKERYGRELAGEGLGQFHIDFSMKDKNGKELNDVHSKFFICLGKKCYLDVLEGTDDNGVVHTDYHVRMKGVSKAALEEAKKRYGGYENLYMALARGEEVEFILNPTNVDENKENPIFAFEKNGTPYIQKANSFTRKIKF
jgi:hypothetical protein